MLLTIISIGKIKEQYTIDWERELIKRLSPYERINFIEIKEEPITQNKNPEIVKQKECERILAKMPPKAFVTALEIGGESFTSEEFAQEIQKIQNQFSEICFIIGGPLGLHEDILQKVNLRLSFSSLTFTHQIMRILLLEQIYRAFCILHNRPYHL